MKKIIIEKADYGGYNVIQGDKYSDGLAYEEMLGVVIALTFPEIGDVRFQNWMKTEQEWREYYDRQKHIINDATIPDVEDETEQKLIENENS